MKTLEIELNKRLLIVEYDTEAELAIDFALMNAFNNPKVIKFGLTLKSICKGSDLTEDIVKGLVEIIWNGYKNYNEKEPVGNYKRLVVNTALESLISSIEASGYHWGENPVSLEREKVYRQMGDTSRADGILRTWQEAESQTFNPEKCIIFEIL